MPGVRFPGASCPLCGYALAAGSAPVSTRLGYTSPEDQAPEKAIAQHQTLALGLVFELRSA